MTPLRAWRKRVGLSQLDLARELRVNKATVNRWEAGLREPPPYLWLALVVVESRVLHPVALPPEAPQES